MSGAFPTAPVFNALEVKSRYYNVVSSSISGRTQGRHLGGHRFEFTAQYPPMVKANHTIVDVFLEQQKGGVETFTIVLPQISAATGSPSGTVLVDGVHAIGDSTIAIDGLTGTLTAGDYVVFTSHTKAYKITADLTGAGTLSIMPPLIVALADNEAVTYDSVPFTVRQKGDTQEVKLSPGVFYSREVDFIEAV